MKLDCFTHIFPVKFFERMEEVVENKAPIKRWLNIPMLYDVDARLRIMDTFGEYQQILTLSAPPIEAQGNQQACRQPCACGAFCLGSSQSTQTLRPSSPWPRRE